ncbi:MAG: anaerobic ribonucleoside-triphosphate reductase activating protein, partial [Chloroflexota bacterium]
SALLCRIKAMGFLVKLDTNGSKSNVLQDLLKNNLVDYIAMDIKAPLHMYNRLSGVRASISQIIESIALISQSGIAHEFRTTVVKFLLSAKDVRVIQKLVPSGSTHHLQKFCPEHAFDPALRKYTNIYSGDLPL